MFCSPNREVSGFFVQHDVPSAPHYRHREIVSLLEMGRFAVVDLYELMAYGITPPERSFAAFSVDRQSSWIESDLIDAFRLPCRAEPAQHIEANSLLTGSFSSTFTP